MHLNYQEHEFDVCVIGGGMAGTCAALAAARRGARTALVQDRPVLGGNASSEVRMWICGAHGPNNKETGLLEEIQLDNLYHNPSLNYSQWDAVLWARVRFQPNLTLFMNSTVTAAEMDGSRIGSVTAWQMTSQTWHTLHARYFIDCSGDSILAAVTPAQFRVGREARSEFHEDIEPAVADHKTMGNSLLIQLRRTDEPQPFTAPRWAYKFNGASDLPNRISGVNGDNFWWLEIGGLNDTIRDAEAIRDELMRMGYGVWDYIKNRAPEKEKAANWALDWIGSHPGKRESRRYVGDHTLTQNDIGAGGRFEDVVAFGGWSMDDHHPAGILYPGQPTIFHPAPSPYGIPYRSLYSINVPNLLFAGRNISVTHAGLSSTRVMATCSTLGQAAGTAAALCVKHHGDPRSLSSGERLHALQTALMADDAWLPGTKRPASPLALSATLHAPSGDTTRLLDGVDRDRPGEPHAWIGACGQAIEFQWNHEVTVAQARLVLDSNLNNDKRMPCSYPVKGDRRAVPGSLLKAYRIEAADASGRWQTMVHEQHNYQRLVRAPIERPVTALRLVPEETWGDAEARLFAFEPLAVPEPELPVAPDGPSFAEVRARIAPIDLAPPENGKENNPARHSA